MKGLATALVISAVAIGVAGCFDSLSDSVERLAGIPGEAVRQEIEEGMAAAAATEEAKTAAWVAEQEAKAGIGGESSCGPQTVADCNAMSAPADRDACLASNPCP